MRAGGWLAATLRMKPRAGNETKRGISSLPFMALCANRPAMKIAVGWGMSKGFIQH